MLHSVHFSSLGIMKFLWQILIYYTNVLWIDAPKYSFNSIWFSICFSRLDRDKTTNLKNMKLSFYKINFTTCSPLKPGMFKKFKAKSFFFSSICISINAWNTDAKCSTSTTLLYQTIVFYYQKAVMSHVCVVMVMVGCIRQYTKN